MTLHQKVWDETSGLSDNAIATATHAAEADRRHYIKKVSASFDVAIGAPLELVIRDGVTVIWRHFFTDEIDMDFDQALEGAVGALVEAEIEASGTAAVNGVVNISGYTI